ncbi:MAG TPA: hypothetical protein VND21_04835, partial [Planctomycetota bacterium]|nr:hypothetical protein [Planctomycetota bacterium]
MADVIQCPTCSKKFRLPERPPAVFTCTGCGTAMDLSSFRAAAPAAPVAAPPGAPSAEAPAKTSRRSSATRAHGARTSRSSASRGARARRGAAAPAEEGDDAGGRLAPPKDNSKTILVASLIGLVVVGGIGFLALRKKDPPTPAPKESASGVDGAVEADSLG